MRSGTLTCIGCADASYRFGQEHCLGPSASVGEVEFREETDGDLVVAWSNSASRGKSLASHGAQSDISQAKNALGVRVAEANAERAARSKVEEELEATKRTIIKLNERQETMAATSVSAGELKLQEERDKLLVRCGENHNAMGETLTIAENPSLFVL